MRTAWILVAALLSADAVTGCVNSLIGYQPPTGIGSVTVVPHGFPSWGELAIDRAMNDWNQPSCNADGTDFPYFQAQSATGASELHVFWVPGFSPDGLGPSVCGYFSKESKFINLFEKTRDKNGVERSCGGVYEMADHIAHEIGHYLGLGDAPSYCGPSLIMSAIGLDANGNMILRDPVAAECGRADDLNETPLEQQASPVDPYCDAQCWTACQGGQCPTRPPGFEGCPILLDLDQNGFHLTGIDDPVWFDIDADGVPEWTSWTDGGDAFLVLDRNDNGLIDDGSELFGNHTILANGRPAPNGYEALAEFDLRDFGGNHDGWIDAGDWVFRFLRVWTDLNHNGASDASEVQTLEEAGVTRVGWHYHRTQRRDRHGNEFRFKGQARILGPGRSERTMPTWDVFFVVQD